MRRVLVDTGAIYAFVVRTDAHHQEAKAFMRDLLSARDVLVLADCVFAETMTLLKARGGPNSGTGRYRTTAQPGLPVDFPRCGR